MMEFMESLLTWQTLVGFLSGLIIALITGKVGLTQGREESLGRIMKLDEVPRNVRLQFRGLTGAEEGYFLFAESHQTATGLQFHLESRIARSPGGKLNTMNYCEEFMIVENRMDNGLVAFEFMKLIR